MRLLASGWWRLALTWLRLTRQASDVGRRLGLVLVPLLGVLGLEVIQDVHPVTATLGKVEDVEVISEVSEEVTIQVIIHARHGVKITLLKVGWTLILGTLSLKRSNFLKSPFFKCFDLIHYLSRRILNSSWHLGPLLQ